MYLPSGMQCKASLLSLSVSEASAPCWSWKHWNQQESQVGLQITVYKKNYLCGSPNELMGSYCNLKSYSSLIVHCICRYIHIITKYKLKYTIQSNYKEYLQQWQLYKIYSIFYIESYCTLSQISGWHLPSTLLLPSRDCLRQCEEKYHCQIPYTEHQHLFTRKLNYSIRWLIMIIPQW